MNKQNVFEGLGKIFYFSAALEYPFSNFEKRIGARKMDIQYRNHAGVQPVNQKEKNESCNIFIKTIQKLVEALFIPRIIHYCPDIVIISRDPVPLRKYLVFFPSALVP